MFPYSIWLRHAAFKNGRTNQVFFKQLNFYVRKFDRDCFTGEGNLNDGPLKLIIIFI